MTILALTTITTAAAVPGTTATTTTIIIFVVITKITTGTAKATLAPPRPRTVDTRVCVGVCVLGGRQTFIVCLELVTLRQGQQREKERVREGKWREKE